MIELIRAHDELKVAKLKKLKSLRSSMCVSIYVVVFSLVVVFFLTDINFHFDNVLPYTFTRYLFIFLFILNTYFGLKAFKICCYSSGFYEKSEDEFDSLLGLYSVTRNDVLKVLLEKNLKMRALTLDVYVKV